MIFVAPVFPSGHSWLAAHGQSGSLAVGSATVAYARDRFAGMAVWTRVRSAVIAGQRAYPGELPGNDEWTLTVMTAVYGCCLVGSSTGRTVAV
ncbi:MAG: hypothetical protein J07HX5_00992 [halophilic archaeon J07HX5]|nr:MAG: hypothetical protein J07HX5_00992 [halophilic archaeon J07HX5]